MAEDEDPPSFDPRTWGRRDLPPPQPAPARSIPRRRLIAAGGAAAAAAAAGLAFLALRPSPRRAGAAAQPGLPPPIPLPATSDLLALEADLPKNHVAAQDSAAAAQALLRAFGSASGPFWIKVQTEGGPPPRRILWLEARRDAQGVRLDRVDDGFRAASVPVRLTPRLRLTDATDIDKESFYEAAAPKMADSLVYEFVRVMSYDFDFANDFWKGGQFQAGIEEDYDDVDRLVGKPRLVMAFIQANPFFDDRAGVPRPGRSKRLFRFAGDGAWYDFAGTSAVRSLLRTPVDGARVSSGFGPRLHPILDRIINHMGVDFACSKGTAVYAAADGQVIECRPDHGRQSYGNFMLVKHDEHLVTGYAHLDAFGEGMVPGVAVKQGQIIARSGDSGQSTGPHLHFEVRYDKTPVDPLTFENNAVRRLAGTQLDQLRVRARAIEEASR